MVAAPPGNSGLVREPRRLGVVSAWPGTPPHSPQRAPRLSCARSALACRGASRSPAVPSSQRFAHQYRPDLVHTSSVSHPRGGSANRSGRAGPGPTVTMSTTTNQGAFPYSVPNWSWPSSTAKERDELDGLSLPVPHHRARDVGAELAAGRKPGLWCDRARRDRHVRPANRRADGHPGAGPGDCSSAGGDCRRAGNSDRVARARATAVALFGNELFAGVSRWPRLVQGLHACVERSAQAAERTAGDLSAPAGRRAGARHALAAGRVVGSVTPRVSDCR